MPPKPPFIVEDVLSRMLQHPWTMAIKRRLRDAWWDVRGARFTNPPIAGATRLMFVCQGNICRSPFAAILAERAARTAGLAMVTCQSSGYDARPGHASPAAAIEAARAHGIDLSSHRAHAFDLESDADLVIVMEVAQAALLSRRYPAAADRIVVLPLITATMTDRRGYDRFNIGDPFGKSVEVFESCYAQIASTIPHLIARLEQHRAAVEPAKDASC